MKNVDLTVKDLRVFLTRRECNKTLKTNKFPSTCKVFSPTHLRRLLLSGPTDGFTNLLIRLQVRRRSIKLYLESGYQDFVWKTRLTCSRAKIDFDEGFLFQCDHTMYTASTNTDGRSN